MDIYCYLILLFNLFKNAWGLGIGDWGLGIGDWAQSPIPNPQYLILLRMHHIVNIIITNNINN